jgi:ribose-phosphate pyrophosphokinase
MMMAMGTAARAPMRVSPLTAVVRPVSLIGSALAVRSATPAALLPSWAASAAAAPIRAFGSSASHSTGTGSGSGNGSSGTAVSAALKLRARRTSRSDAGVLVAGTAIAIALAIGAFAFRRGSSNGAPALCEEKSSKGGSTAPAAPAAKPGSEESEMIIFSGRANPALATEIASHLGVSLGSIRIGSYADGEIGLQVNENVRGKDVYLIQPTCPPGVNDNLIELILMISTMRRASARRITAVIPYYGALSHVCVHADRRSCKLTAD